MIDPKLLEQFKNDTKLIIEFLIQYAQTWGEYGYKLESQLSPEQRTEIENIFKEFDDALADITKTINGNCNEN